MGKSKIKLQPDAPAPPRRAPKLIAEAAPPRPDEPPPFDWRADPTCRAFACFLSYSAGWAQLPENMTWSFDETSGTTTIVRPAWSDSPQDRVSGHRPSASDVDTLIDQIGERWGRIVRENVRDWVHPYAPASPPQDRPGRDARLLHQLANQVATAGPTRENVEKALVEVVLRCGSLARAANINDTSPSATRTRNLTAAAILELLGTQSA